LPRVIKIDHIGLAVESISQDLEIFSEGLGLELQGTENVGTDGVVAAFLPVGESRLELLEPMEQEGPVRKFLQNRGQGVHHVCLEVEDLPGLLARLRERGVELIDDQPRPGAHGTQVAFVHPKSANGVLIELVEPTGGQSAVATFVSEQGEGVQHLGYRIPDVAAAIAEAEALGFKAEWTVDDEHGLAVAFLPPGAFFGISIELVRSEPPVDLQKWMK